MSAYDADTQSLDQTLTATVAKTFSHTVTGANPAIVIAVAMPDTDPGTWTVTYGGTTCPAIGNVTFTGSGRVYTFGLAPCATGSNTVSITSSLGTLTTDLIAQSFSGANQTGGSTTFNGFVSQASTVGQATVSVTVTSGSTSDIVMTITESTINNHSSQGAGQTNRWEDNAGAINTAGSTKAGASGTVQMDETWDATDSVGGMANVVGINISNAAAGGRTTKNTRSAPLGMEVGMNFGGSL